MGDVGKIFPQQEELRTNLVLVFEEPYEQDTATSHVCLEVLEYRQSSVDGKQQSDLLLKESLNFMP